MGSTDKLKMDEASTENPKVGKECTKVTFASESGWAGVVWQHPAGDWGDAPGGFDLTGASRLTFWARGNVGGEKVTIGIGNIAKPKIYHDTFTDKKELTLTKEWQQFELDLTGKDLTRIKSALYFTTASEGQPLAFFLDEITIK